MGRSRKAVWQSEDSSVYIKHHKGGYLVVDTRGRRPEVLRRKLDEALAIAEGIVGTAPKEVEMTFFELAAMYFTDGLPLWDKSREVALTANTIEDRKARIRNYYAFVGNTGVSSIPSDVLSQAETVLRKKRPNASLSLTVKVVRDGANILEYGRRKGIIDASSSFPPPPQLLRDEKLNRKNFSGRHGRRVVPSHRTVHRLARAAAGHSGAEHMRLFFWLLAYLGMREGELCALTVDDVEQSKRMTIHIRKKIVWRPGAGTIIEDHAKNRSHRTIVVPHILEGPIRARVDEVHQAGGSLLFPRWNHRRGAGEAPIDYSGLKELFVRAGADSGMAVKTWSTARKIRGTDGRVRNYKRRPQSLEFKIHDLRAFAATTMTEPRSGGISLRGMGMTIEATAKQLGDEVETVKRVYLGIWDGNVDLLNREVP